MTVTDRFDEAMTLTLGHEGGWYDGSKPSDPNPTMFGVIQKTYDAYRTKHNEFLRSVRLIDRDELKDIYAEYWIGTCDEVSLRLRLTALCLFDMSINGGAGTARKILQTALDLQDDGDLGDLDADGRLGPQTLFAIRKLPSTADKTLCMWLLMERVRYYDNLAESERQRPNLKSWLGRTVHFYERFIRGA